MAAFPQPAGEGQPLAITRRSFLAGSAALGASVAAGLRAAAETLPPVPVLDVGPTFTTEARRSVDAEWFHICAAHSEWQFDSARYRQPLIRHRMTGLTYRLSFDAAGQLEARQLASQCCPCREDLDPDKIVGHAAVFVAEFALMVDEENVEDYGGQFYLSFRVPFRPWPEPTAYDPEADPFEAGLVNHAPPIEVSPLSVEAVAACEAARERPASHRP